MQVYSSRIIAMTFCMYSGNRGQKNHLIELSLNGPESNIMQGLLWALLARESYNAFNK